jgi:hypothetical protein
MLANVFTQRNLKRIAILAMVPATVCIISMFLNNQTPEQYIQGFLTQYSRFSATQNSGNYDPVFSSNPFNAIISIFLLSPFLFPKFIILPLKANLGLGPLQILPESFVLNYFVGFIIYILIFYFIIKVKKDTLGKFILGIFIYNLFLHVILQYGLYEGFIYTSHYLVSVILMLGYAVRNLLILNRRKLTIGLISILILVAGYILVFNLLKANQIFGFLISQYPR